MTEQEIQKKSVIEVSESDKMIDTILPDIYRYTRYFDITFEQSVEFIRRRYYRIHLAEKSYQIDLSALRDTDEIIKKGIEEWSK
jgi:hypothetical protein